MQYNKDWLSEQIIKNRDSMYRFALSIMKNHDDACDAVSEAERESFRQETNRAPREA